MYHDPVELAPDVEALEQPVVHPGDRIEDLDPLDADLVHQAVGARAGVDDDRQLPALAPARQRVANALRHRPRGRPRSPSRLHGVPQQLPAMSSRDPQRQSRARPRSRPAPRAGSGCVASSRALPKIRLMHAGMYTAAAPSRTVNGSCPGAAAGTLALHAGTRRCSRPPQGGRKRGHTLIADGSGSAAAARTLPRAARSSAAKRRAAPAASASALGPCSRRRKSLISWPVSIPTGQA